VKDQTGKISIRGEIVELSYCDSMRCIRKMRGPFEQLLTNL